MQRTALETLAAWKNRPGRKPLVVRGARQVGKSWLARTFGEQSFGSCAVVNFERDPRVSALFESKAPARILPLLELHLGMAIRPGRAGPYRRSSPGPALHGAGGASRSA